MVHLAMHDAYFWRYVAGPRPAPDYPIFYSFAFSTSYPAAQRDAAVAGAAYAVLMALYPALSDLFVTGSDLFRPGMEATFDLGSRIGAAVVDIRSNDGSSEASGDVRPNRNRYDHREDPTNLGQGLLHPSRSPTHEPNGFRREAIYAELSCLPFWTCNNRVSCFRSSATLLQCKEG
jgi:hypothetical protein